MYKLNLIKINIDIDILLIFCVLISLLLIHHLIIHYHHLLSGDSNFSGDLLNVCCMGVSVLKQFSSSNGENDTPGVQLILSYFTTSTYMMGMCTSFKNKTLIFGLAFCTCTMI